MVPVTVNGMPGFAQYKPAADGDGYTAWAIQAPEIRGDKIVRLNAFLDVEALFPMFGLPLRDGRLKKIIGFTVVPRAPVMPELGAHARRGRPGWRARACGRR